MQTDATKHKKSRYSVGGDAESVDGAIGWWERVSFDVDISDSTVEISKQYAGRPDLMASHMYGNDALGWLILQYNNIVDIHEEFIEGKIINLPSPERVMLGLTI